MEHVFLHFSLDWWYIGKAEYNLHFWDRKNIYKQNVEEWNEAKSLKGWIAVNLTVALLWLFGCAINLPAQLPADSVDFSWHLFLVLLLALFQHHAFVKNNLLIGLDTKGLKAAQRKWWYAPYLQYGPHSQDSPLIRVTLTWPGHVWLRLHSGTGLRQD